MFHLCWKRAVSALANAPEVERGMRFGGSVSAERENVDKGWVGSAPRWVRPA
jgi:hypothetical protein